MAIADPSARDEIKSCRLLYRPSRQAMRRGLFAPLLAVAAGPALAAPPELPAIVEPGSHETHIGKVIFVELVTPDLAAAKLFYAGLFGWTYRDIPVAGGEYAEAYLGSDPVAGLIHKPVPSGEHRQPAWLSFFAARDVDATKQVALQHGAKMLVEPHTLPNRGREAVLADPESERARGGPAPHGYRSAPASRPMPSIPSGSRSGGSRR